MDIDKIKKMPLFIITGASGAGKSALSDKLFENEKDYIVMESDILWNEAFNNPENDYKGYRELWLRLCRNISQIGVPVVLCGCSTPEQFEYCDERQHFSDIYYLAVVCDDTILSERLRNGRNVDSEEWINSSISFNKWLKENAHKTEPSIVLLDNSNLSIDETTEKADKWIRKYLNK